MLVAVATVHATTTSRLEGKVVDEVGGNLARVEVNISSDSLIGGPQLAVTDGRGGFAFNLLPVGEYRVEATLAGYRPVTAVAQLRLDRTASVTLRLVPLSFGAEIVVGAEVPIIDATRTSTGEVFDADYLKLASIGIDSRDYVKVMDQAAGVVPGGFQRVYGAFSSENAYLVDGFNTTDSSTGLSATKLTFDAVEEASVLTGGVGADLGLGTGGVVNVVTKSGGNTFSGTIDARYRDQGFNESGDHYDPDENVSSTRRLAFTLGGPILRDRLWFFAAYENTLTEKTPVGAPVTQIGKGNYLLGKLTWAIDNANRLTLRHTTTPRTGEYSGVDFYTAPEATRRVETSEPITQLGLDSVLSNALLLTVNLGINREYVEVYPMVNDVNTPPEWDDDAIWLFSNPLFVEDGDRHRDHHRAKLSWFAGDALGSHQVDTGVEYHKIMEEVVAFTPGGYSIDYYNNDYWDEPWPDGDGDGLVDLYLYRDAPPETARDPTVATGEGWSAFVQDQWRPVPQLTVRLGLRYDSMEHTNTVGQTVADFEKLMPRVGVAWDVDGRSRHVVRAGWSQYMHPGGTNVGYLVPGITRGTEWYWGRSPGE